MRKTLLFLSGFIDLMLHAICVLLWKHTKHYFAKKWLNLPNVFSKKTCRAKILAKIEIYNLTRAKLLYPLCYEIPCMLDVCIRFDFWKTTTEVSGQLLTKVDFFLFFYNYMLKVRKYKKSFFLVLKYSKKTNEIIYKSPPPPLFKG